MIKQPRAKSKQVEQVGHVFVQVFQALQPYQRQRTYRRIFTPLVLVWCLIYQRLNAKHSCDAVVSELRAGGMDHLGDAHKAPLSQRMRSESSAGFCKARERIPLQVLAKALEETVAYAARVPCKTLAWLDRGVFVLDGSTLRVRPYPELVRRYGVHKTRKKVSYWVVVRVVVLFCLHNGLVSGTQEGSLHESEVVLGAKCLFGMFPGYICIAYRGIGIFQMVQAVRHVGGEALFRLSRTRARKLYREQLYPGQDLDVTWAPSQKDTLHAGMSAEPVAGRLIYLRFERPGFRSQDLYLFTTLLDRQRYTRERLIELYGLRWHAELNLRFLKDTLDLHGLEAKSVDVVRKEWYAGMLAYNLVRIFILQAASQSSTAIGPLELSFSQARERVFLFLFTQWPHLAQPSQCCQDLLQRIARCRLPKRAQPRIEPRWIRPPDQTFPPFWIERYQARRAYLCQRNLQTVC